MKTKKCGIYRIAFMNGKNYIGQSVDIETRYKDHYRASHPEIYSMKGQRDANLPVHKAMAKYENKQGYFLEILELCDKEQLDEREKYWIKYYKSHISQNGYNIAYGGQDSFALKRENHSQAKLTENQVKKIKQAIIKREKTFTEIADEFDVSRATITMINRGKCWKDEGVHYPLVDNVENDFVAHAKQRAKRKFSAEEVQKIRYMRNVEKRTLPEISHYFNDRCSLAMLKNIAKYQSYKDIP